MLASTVVAQQLRLGTAAGIDVNVLGHAETKVEETRQGMPLGVVLAAPARCAAPARRSGSTASAWCIGAGIIASSTARREEAGSASDQVEGAGGTRTSCAGSRCGKLRTCSRSVSMPGSRRSTPSAMKSGIYSTGPSDSPLRTGDKARSTGPSRSAKTVALSC